MPVFTLEVEPHTNCGVTTVAQIKMVTERAIDELRALKTYNAILKKELGPEGEQWITFYKRDCAVYGFFDEQTAMRFYLEWA